MATFALAEGNRQAIERMAHAEWVTELRLWTLRSTPERYFGEAPEYIPWRIAEAQAWLDALLEAA